MQLLAQTPQLLYFDVANILEKRAAWAKAQPVTFSAMAIKGEVHIRKVLHLPIASFNQGRYVIRPFECEVTGKAEGR